MVCGEADYLADCLGIAVQFRRLRDYERVRMQTIATADAGISGVAVNAGGIGMRCQERQVVYDVADGRSR